MSFEILCGDARELLKTLPSESVQMVCTSPPYWGLREYGTGRWEGGDLECDHRIQLGGSGAASAKQVTSGGTQGYQARGTCPKCGAVRHDAQIGLESTPDAYVAEMVALFREVWRVLRPDGTVFLNLGDAFASQGGHSSQGETSARVGRANVDVQNEVRGFRPGLQPGGIKPKDLIGLPWMVAFALRADGWWLRQDNVWSKLNPMPESIDSRTTRAHEYIFQLAKSGSPLFWTHRDLPGVRQRPEPDYRWVHRKTKQELLQAPAGWPDDEAIRKAWRRINLWEGHDYFYDAVAIEEEASTPAGTKGAKGSAARAAEPGVNGRPPEYAVYNGRRNKRSVWNVATQPFSESHFATMPPEIAETCILAGTSERGCCRACGAPWSRVTEEIDTGLVQKMADGWDTGDGAHGTIHRAGREKGAAGNPVMRESTIGWRPTCTCDAGEPVPCVVLDPFAGAGTSLLVADRLGRHGIGIELNPDYIEMARRRITTDAPLLVTEKAVPVSPEPVQDAFL